MKSAKVIIAFYLVCAVAAGIIIHYDALKLIGINTKTGQVASPGTGTVSKDQGTSETDTQTTASVDASGSDNAEAEATTGDSLATEDIEAATAEVTADDGAAAEKTAKKKKKKKEKPFYTYKSNAIYSDLRLRDGIRGNIIDFLPAGYKGYVIRKGDESCLILYKGQLGYAATDYLTITKIKEKDYPKELKKLSEDNIGEKLFDGKAFGDVETEQ